MDGEMCGLMILAAMERVKALYARVPGVSWLTLALEAGDDASGSISLYADIEGLDVEFNVDGGECAVAYASIEESVAGPYAFPRSVATSGLSVLVANENVLDAYLARLREAKECAVLTQKEAKALNELSDSDLASGVSWLANNQNRLKALES